MLIVQVCFYSLENGSLVFKTNLLPHFTFFHLTVSEGIIAHTKASENITKFSASLFSLFQWH